MFLILELDTCIVSRFIEGKVFVALGNGDLVVYCRDIGKDNY